jgi:hypothetical protein
VAVALRLSLRLPMCVGPAARVASRTSTIADEGRISSRVLQDCTIDADVTMAYHSVDEMDNNSVGQN